MRYFLTMIISLVYGNTPPKELSDLMLENIEALSTHEIDPFEHCVNASGICSIIQGQVYEFPGMRIKP